MPVPSVITDLNVVAASNSPAGADSVASNTGPDEYFRALSAIIKREQSQGTATASAATVDLGAITTGSYLHITGTTNISAFGTVSAGIERTLVFDGVLTLTHNATSMILPGAVDIKTAAGDAAVFRSEGSGNWRCVHYLRKRGDDHINVKNYGATGDGATDDTVAIQAAVTAAGDFATVLFPAGTYKVTATITLKPMLSLVGDGAAITFTSTTSSLFSYVPGTPTGYPGRIGFYNLKITGGGNLGTAWAIKIDANSPFIVVKGCHITSFFGGIYLRDCFDSAIDDNLISTASYGVQLVRSSHATTLRNNFVDACTVAGLAINYGGGAGTGAIHNITVDGGAYQNSATGIWAENCYALHTFNVYHEGNTSYDYKIGVADAGAYLRACFNTVIDGFETASACGSGTNVEINHSVGTVVRAAAFNTGCSTIAALVAVDAFSDRSTIDLFRYTTVTPTDTVPVNATGTPERTVVYYRGRPIYPYGATDAIKFGTLATARGRIYQGDGVSARSSLIIEAQEANADVLLKTSASGLVRVTNASNTAQFDFDILNGSNKSYFPLIMKEYTVATLPASGAYSRCFVTDANATTFASVVAGGGANKVPVYHDGTNWRIG